MSVSQGTVCALMVMPVVNSAAFHLGILGWPLYWLFPFPFLAITFFSFHAFIRAFVFRDFA